MQKAAEDSRISKTKTRMKEKIESQRPNHFFQDLDARQRGSDRVRVTYVSSLRPLQSPWEEIELREEKK